jgi:hypothetical protein
MTRRQYLDGHDALLQMVGAARQSRQQIAAHLCTVGLWPPMKPTSRTARFDACLNPDKDQYFKWSDVLEMMRFTQRFDPLHYLCDQLALERPDPLDSHARLASLADDMRQATNALEAVSTLLTEALGEHQGIAQPRTNHSVARFSRTSLLEGIY